MQAPIHKKIGTKMFIAALSRTAPNWKQPNQRMDNQAVVESVTLYSMKCYSAMKRNMFTATWWNLKKIFGEWMKHYTGIPTTRFQLHEILEWAKLNVGKTRSVCIWEWEWRLTGRNRRHFLGGAHVLHLNRDWVTQVCTCVKILRTLKVYAFYRM